MSFKLYKNWTISTHFSFAMIPLTIYLILVDLMHFGGTAEDFLCVKKDKALTNNLHFLVRLSTSESTDDKEN